jgi:xanthosine utilization system XapX-like protein
MKEILKALIAALVPILYALLKNVLPEFPLTASQLLELILFLVGFAIGGWQVSKSFYLANQRLIRRASADGIEWKAMLKAVAMALVPFFYVWLTNVMPGFPLDENTFLRLLLYLIGFGIGGWQAAKAVYIGQSRLRDVHGRIR